MKILTKTLLIQLFSLLPKWLNHTIWTVRYLFLKTKGAPPKLFKLFLFDRFLEKNSMVFESGTFLAESTKYLAARNDCIWTCDIQQELIVRAKGVCPNNVILRHGESTKILPEFLEYCVEKKARKIGFWLDGHSSDNNFAGSSENAPIITELNLIVGFCNNLEYSCEVTVLIDDVRYMTEIEDVRDKKYPHLNQVIDTCIRQQFDWTIMHNVLIIRKNYEGSLRNHINL